MKISISIILLSVLIHLSSPLGDLPESGDFESPEALTSSDAAPVLNSGVVGGEDGPTPPSVVAAPLDPLPEMSIPVARPPGFRPPTSFIPKKDSGENSEHVNVGFVIRRGRAKVMGFSRRKSESSD
ncbi:Protein CBG02585 [Caenorhabditis briggsae]|uniref:Protein CBG02585 n=1 Tax=Caenorhabditis briggsae TaxID=6238 RepID=A8WTZ6_CAEBR|nr:Protein CBG02585 [Caenorhabditis briggsae]CAP23958.1 Protein CBG02585 [Caenorhabditis briggsae]